MFVSNIPFLRGSFEVESHILLAKLWYSEWDVADMSSVGGKKATGEFLQAC